MGRLWFFLTIGLTGTAILVALGVWQVQRLAWKQGVLEQVAVQIAADPVPLEDALMPKFLRYAPFEVSGTFGSDHIRMLASRRNIGPVYRIIRPFTPIGETPILVDTGWQPVSRDVAPPPAVVVRLTGNLDSPIESDRFTPAPDLSDNIWFARDVMDMAAALKTAPVLVVLDAAPVAMDAVVSEIDLGVTPWPLDTAGIPNNHLQYAVTWFSLATIWLAMSTYFVLRARARGARPEPED